MNSGAQAIASSLRGKSILSVLDLSPRKLGSIEEYLAVLSSEIRKIGGTSIVAAASAPSPDVAEVFRQSGVIHEVVSFGKKPTRTAEDLTAILKKYAPHIVHFHFVPFSSPLLALPKSPCSRIFVSEHISVEPVPRSPFVLRLAAFARNAWQCRKVTRFITPSDYSRNHIIQDCFIPPRRTVTIHNGVNLSRHAPGRNEPIDIRARYGIPPGDKIIIHIAYAHKYKGIDDFVRSALVLKERKIAFRYLVVGDGDSMPEYRALAKELCCDDRITFTGMADGTMVNSLLAQCDVSTLACTWGEAFSLIVLESMARGKAIVATAVGGTPEAIIDGESSLLVPPWNWRKFGEAICRVLEDDDLRTRLGASARARAEKLFDINRWVMRTLALYATSDPDACGQ
jgi:glycosyltransferase involved in cell wall biosynthesis